MAPLPIDLGMAAGEVLRRYPDTLEVFDHHGVVFCAGCYLTLFDPLEDVAGYHAVHDVPAFLADLNRVAAQPPGERPAWAQGSFPDGAAATLRPLGPDEERRVVDAMAQDPLAKAWGIGLVAVGEGSAQVAVEAATGTLRPALAAALATVAAQAADLTLRRTGGQLAELHLGPFDAGGGPGTLVADAHHALGSADGSAQGYHVRLVGPEGRTLGAALVRLVKTA
jgi:hypothetical protein